MGNRNINGRKVGYIVNNGALPKDEVKTLTDKRRGQDQRMEKQTVDSKSGMDSPSLPYASVDSSLRALAGQAEGFGRSAVGGLHGPLYHVTSLLDDGPGSLRFGCRQKEPLWIVFKLSGTIDLKSYLNISSYKTIDGRGQRVKLTGKGLRLKECEHVIVSNLEFEGGKGHDVDGIQIKPKSKHIWIDRCSLRDYEDGLIDITRQSTDITISRCHFSNHDKTMLIGGDASNIEDRCIRVTIHHCFFDGTRQRHPRVRFGKVHLYNNYTRNWGIYAVCASVESQIYSECNIYEAGEKRVAFKYLKEKAADKEEEKSGHIKSQGDWFVGLTQHGMQPIPTSDKIFHPNEYYPSWTMSAANDKLKQVLQHCSGWQDVHLPVDTVK